MDLGWVRELEPLEPELRELGRLALGRLALGRPKLRELELLERLELRELGLPAQG
jgi:hypothetical protein